MIIHQQSINSNHIAFNRISFCILHLLAALSIRQFIQYIIQKQMYDIKSLSIEILIKLNIGHQMKTLLLSMCILELVLSSQLSENGLTYSIEISQLAPASEIRDWRYYGVYHIVVRGLTPYGEVDTLAEQNLLNAQSAGDARDIIMFPCRSKSVNSQVDEMMNKIPQKLYDKVWIKVITNPTASCPWNGFHITRNCQYILDIIKRIKSYEKWVGIYTSKEMWKSIIGKQSGCPEIAKEAPKLWYFHYDNQETFDDFTPFGGWQKPYMKQCYERSQSFVSMIDGKSIFDASMQCQR